MNVGQLRELLAELPAKHDDAPLLVEGCDHSYNGATAKFCDVAQHKRDFYEYYDDSNLSPGEKRTKGLVIL